MIAAPVRHEPSRFRMSSISALIREADKDGRHIGDFTNWKAHDAYQTAFKRLLRDLKPEPLTGRSR